MMLDYLTLSIDGMDISQEVRDYFERKQNMLVCFTSEGEVVWRRPQLERVRSDTHEVSAQLCSKLDIWGSPARCMGDGKSNVFGSFDINECFHGMLGFVEKQIGAELPHDPEPWRVRRVDLTGNFHLGALETVIQALNYLRHSEGGRYQVRTSAETVYWSKGSSLRTGKAYAKGPHMQVQAKKGKAELTEKQMKMVQTLLRLELKLGSTWWSRTASKPWFKYSQKEFLSIFQDYFKQFIGSVEVSEVKDDVLKRLYEVAPTPGQARAALTTWSLIQTHGEQAARKLISRSAWYKHRALLRKVGISFADFHERRIVPFRRRTIVLGDPVTSWEDLESRCG